MNHILISPALASSKFQNLLFKISSLYKVQNIHNRLFKLLLHNMTLFCFHCNKIYHSSANAQAQLLW